MEKIAAHFDWDEQTVRDVLHKWRKQGLESLWELPGRGLKPKWKEEDIVFLEQCLRTEPRTYNSSQLSQKLNTERNVQLSPDRLRRVLKKRGASALGGSADLKQLAWSIGNAQEKAIKENKTQS